MRVSLYQCEGKLYFYTKCDPCTLTASEHYGLYGGVEESDLQVFALA
jgi:hypothetical protein